MSCAIVETIYNVTIKSIFPIGTVILDKRLLEKLEKFYVLKKLKGAEVYLTVKEREAD